MQLDTAEETPISESPRKPKIAVQYLWVFLGLLLLALGFFFGANYSAVLPGQLRMQGGNVVSDLETPVSTSEITAEMSDNNLESKTDDWKMYWNEKFYFSIEYPSSITEYMTDSESGRTVPDFEIRDQQRVTSTSDYDRMMFWQGPDSVFIIDIFETPVSTSLIEFWKSQLPPGTNCASITRYGDTSRRGFCYKDFLLDGQTFTETYDFDFYNVIQTDQNYEIYKIQHEVDGKGMGDMYLVRLDEKHVMWITTNLGEDSEKMVNSLVISQRIN